MILAGASLAVAITVCATNIRALRNSYRPLLRPVPQFSGDPRTLRQDVIMVKNIGHGPAVSVVVYRDLTPPAILGVLHVVERPGPSAPTRDDPLARPGRERIWLKDGPLELGAEYRLAYQDVVGVWHLSAFAVHANGFAPRLFGREKSRWQWPPGEPIRIPSEVKARGHVVPAEEL